VQLPQEGRRARAASAHRRGQPGQHACSGPTRAAFITRQEHCSAHVPPMSPLICLGDLLLTQHDKLHTKHREAQGAHKSAQLRPSIVMLPLSTWPPGASMHIGALQCRWRAGREGGDMPEKRPMGKSRKKMMSGNTSSSRSERCGHGSHSASQFTCTRSAGCQVFGEAHRTSLCTCQGTRKARAKTSPMQGLCHAASANPHQLQDHQHQM